jgi:hypothetical protein
MLKLGVLSSFCMSVRVRMRSVLVEERADQVHALDRSWPGLPLKPGP